MSLSIFTYKNPYFNFQRRQRHPALQDVVVFGPDIQAESLHFFHQDIEGLRSAGLQGVVPLYQLLVYFCSALNVVGLYRQEFLQGVGSAVRLQCPDFHFSETLSAVLRLAAQWLLGYQAVWAYRAGVNLVGDQVV